MHRIAEILSNTNENEWRWVPSKLNPADDGTRPSDNPVADSNARWIVGPLFLLDAAEWPEIPHDLASHDIEPERRRINRKMLFAQPKATFIDVNRFSKYARLVRTLAYVRRGVVTMLQRMPQRKGTSSISPRRQLTATEVTEGERFLVRLVQREAFSQELIDLRD